MSGGRGAHGKMLLQRRERRKVAERLVWAAALECEVVGA